MPKISSPLHVLLLAESPYFGGITSHLLAIADAFSNDPGVRLTVATLPGRRADNALGEALRARGRELQVLPMAGSFDLRVLHRLRSFVQDRQIDLVHTHNYRATILAHLAGVPLITTYHGNIPSASVRLRFWQGWEARVLRRLPRVVACSEAARARLAARGVAAERVDVVRNAVAPPKAIEALERSALDFPAGAPLALFVGRLIPSKRCDLLLHAAAEAGWAVAIVGDGPERGRLEALARELRAPVHFAGFQAEPWPWYALADAVVLPSEMEALPMTLIEAAACGKPVLATNAGGIPEVVRHGETGLLVAVGDGEALAEALRKLADQAYRTQLGMAAQARWQACFSPAVMAGALKRIYLERRSQ